jgi:hypothetical protein
MKPSTVYFTKALSLSCFVLVGCNQGFELASFTANPTNNSPSGDGSNTAEPDKRTGDDTTIPTGGNDPQNNDPSVPPRDNARLVSAIESSTQTIENRRKADIVFVIDNSGSMKEEQTLLSQNFNQFISGLTSQIENFDFHLGVISTDYSGSIGMPYNNQEAYGTFLQNGRGSLLAKIDSGSASTPLFLTSVMDPTYLTQRFTANVNLGTKGSGNENGIETAANSMAASLNTAGAHNHGFFRNGVQKNFVIVSDEGATAPDDRYWRENPTGWATYKAQKVAGMNAAAASMGSGNVKIHSIVGFENAPSSCALGSANSLRGTGVEYIEVSNDTGGLSINLCDTAGFSTQLLTLGTVIADTLVRSFNLGHSPSSVDSIRVFLNNSEITRSETNGFSYDRASNRIIIHGLGLETLETITVRIEYTYFQ